jgi:hypothetical protein
MYSKNSVRGMQVLKGQMNPVLYTMHVRNFRRNAYPGFYNQRFKPSQGIDNVYVHNAANIHGANGAESHKTNRDPSKFNYSSNLFKNDYWEWRMRASDYLYQIYARLHRSNDGWTRTLLGYTAFSFMMFNQALLWKIHFVFFAMTTAARIRDKGAEPTVDEVWILDQIFANEKLNKLFTPHTYHVLDYDQEFDEGRDNPYFPEYRTPVSKFFNVDSNTTTGRYKIGDVESGALMTLHFRTMPFSNNKYSFTDPFLVYDLWAEVTHNGEYFEETILKASDVLKTKRIFVLWH